MSKLAKLKARLKTCPKDFTWDEATTLLEGCGFNLVPKTGPSKASHRRFFNEKTGRVFMLARPHPESTLKLYMVKNLLSFLIEEGCIDE